LSHILMFAVVVVVVQALRSLPPQAVAMIMVALSQSRMVPRIRSEAEAKVNLLFRSSLRWRSATTPTSRENSRTRSSTSSRLLSSRLLSIELFELPRVVSRVSIVAAAVAMAAATRS
jgi:hypothetical protein